MAMSNLKHLICLNQFSDFFIHIKEFELYTNTCFQIKLFYLVLTLLLTFLTLTARISGQPSKFFLNCTTL